MYVAVFFAFFLNGLQPFGCNIDLMIHSFRLGSIYDEL